MAEKGQTAAACGRVWPREAAPWPCEAVSGHIWLRLGRVRPREAACGRVWPRLGCVWPRVTAPCRVSQDYVTVKEPWIEHNWMVS